VSGALVSGLLELVGSIVTIVFLALLLSLLLAPLDSLSWWAGWVRRNEPEGSEGSVGSKGSTNSRTPVTNDGSGNGAVAPPPAAPAGGAARGPYVVFLTGVGTMGREIDAWEQQLMDRIAAGLRRGPDAVMVTGLFPFAASAQPLTERLRTGRFWVWMGRVRERHPVVLGRLINWRNLTQVFVSMDPRYGPIFNAGAARSLYAALANHGYARHSGVPVVLIGYSGGAQVCLGAATYLKPVLGVPPTIISLGGAVGSDRGLESIDCMHHLFGSGDVEQRLTARCLPSRWPLAKRSRWNRALADGRIRMVYLGDMIHTGPKGYLDPDARQPDGRSHLEVTAGEMVRLIDGVTDNGSDNGFGGGE
jgi:hypothetical protein